MAQPTPKTSRRRGSLADRFWPKVDTSGGDDACWEWQASLKRNGYGQINIGGGKGMRLAHRASWEINRGPVPVGMCVLHHCDNRRCVNPSHLFLGSIADNNVDMARKSRNRTPLAVFLGRTNGQSKLSDNDVRQIRADYATKRFTMAELGQRYGVSRRAISKVIHGETWSHVS